MIQSLLIAEVLFLLLLHLLLVDRLRFGRNAPNLFLFVQVTTFIATVCVFDPRSPDEFRWVVFMNIGILFFVLGCIGCCLHRRFNHGRELHRFAGRPWHTGLKGSRQHFFISLGVFCAFVAVFYYWVLGFYVPFEALRGYGLSSDVSHAGDIYRELRKEAHYYSDRPLSPGYVSQFKDWLLSLTALLSCALYRYRRDRRTRLLAVFFFLAAVVSMIGTGRRGPVILFVFSLVMLGSWRAFRPLVIPRPALIVFFLVALCVFGTQTALMGRGLRGTFFANFVVGPFYLVKRALIDPPLIQLQIFQQYLHETPTLWGQGWIDSLLIILPGQQFGLGNELHEMLWGGRYGNAGLDLWGELWLNFSWFGATLVSFLLGWGFQELYVQVLRGPKTIVRVVTLSYAGLLLVMFKNPSSVLNFGVVTFGIYLLILRALSGFDRSVFPQATATSPT